MLRFDCCPTTKARHPDYQPTVPCPRSPKCCRPIVLTAWRCLPKAGCFRACRLPRQKREIGHLCKAQLLASHPLKFVEGRSSISRRCRRCFRPCTSGIRNQHKADRCLRLRCFQPPYNGFRAASLCGMLFRANAQCVPKSDAGAANVHFHQRLDDGVQPAAGYRTGSGPFFGCTLGSSEERVRAHLSAGVRGFCRG